MTERFDAIVIGSGQGGTPLAKALADKGWTVALVERRWIGGTCVNVGCTPTKTMVASAKVAYLARRGADYGVGTGEIAIDLKKVRERKRTIVEKSRGSNEKSLRKAGVDILFGEASFTGAKSVHVVMNEGGTRDLEAEKIFLDTGTRPAVPKIEGLEKISFLDNESIMELEAVPERLVVLGAGYIALEFAQMFRRFGSEVTVIEHGERFLPKEDEDIAAEMMKILREDRIEFVMGGEVQSVDEEAGRLLLTMKTDDGERQVQGTHLLVAAGRTPNTDVLQVEKAGVALDEHGYVKVNDRLETNVAEIYAVGDVKGGPAFTHISYDDFRILRTNLLEGGEASIAGRLTNYTMFTDPELGRIGMTEAEARKAGRKIKVAKVTMDYMARAREQDETRGVLKAVVDAETDEILGAAMLGIEGGELAAMVELAMIGGLKAAQLREGVFAHPTRSEVLNTLFGNFEEA